MVKLEYPPVLILTPIKDAALYLDGYFERLSRLTYPSASLSLGMLESDSRDGSLVKARAGVERLREQYADVGLWKHDFGLNWPKAIPRWWAQIQRKRRGALARSRNRLLFQALRAQAWVLWLDVDVVEYPGDIIEQLLATGKRIVQPNCVVEFGGESFDKNAWRGPEKALLSDLRAEGDLVPLDSVGGTMLAIDADLHRDGLIFPPFSYRPQDPTIIPAGVLAMETEGLGLMARDMGEKCWGLPNIEIRHFSG